MVQPRVVVTELRKGDIPFLLDLWQMPEVMRYADEFPRLRHWSRASGVERAWKAYEKWRAELGEKYTQLILRRARDGPIGESFVAPLPEGYQFGRWTKPEGVPSVIADIKLLPAWWGRGLGTEGMQEVVKFVFNRTDCDLFVVPPHVQGNPAAVRVYEKAGFVLKSKRKGAGHRIMELWRERYEKRY